MLLWSFLIRCCLIKLSSLVWNDKLVTENLIISWRWKNRDADKVWWRHQRDAFWDMKASSVFGALPELKSQKFCFMSSLQKWASVCLLSKPRESKRDTVSWKQKWKNFKVFAVKQDMVLKKSTRSDGDESILSPHWSFGAGGLYSCWWFDAVLDLVLCPWEDF